MMVLMPRVPSLPLISYSGAANWLERGLCRPFYEENMQSTKTRRAPCLKAKLWIAIASCSILIAACAAPSRPAWQDAGQKAVFREAAAGPAGRSIEAPTSQNAAQLEPAVVPASFEEASGSASSPWMEFRFVDGHPQDRGMTLEEVLQHTLDHHPLLHARLHEVEAARGRLVTAGLLPNPQLVMSTASPVEGNGSTILTTRVDFTVPTGGKRRWRMAAAGADVVRSQATLARETELVLAEAADAAIEVLYLQELAVLQGELSQLAARTAEVLGGRFQAGTTQYATAIKSRLDAGEIELARLATRGRLEQARVRLNRAAGLSPAPLVPMRGELPVKAIPPLRLERLLAEAERSRPELAESRAAVVESQQRYGQARAEAIPDLVLGPRVRDTLGATGDRVGARVAVDLPLFDRNQGRIAESAAMIGTRCAMLDATEINSLSDVAAAYLELQAAQTQLDYYRTHVQPVVEQTEAVIRAVAPENVLAPGQVSELLEQLARTRVEQLDLRYLHARLRTRLEVLLGRPLEDLQEAG
jgi:cobalt-zinc-cadmium efflux system outer membrane protein